PASAGLAADDQESSSRRESSTKVRQSAIASDVEDDVVAVARGEVVAGVVDDVVGAEGSDEFNLGGAAHAADFGTEGLRDLHGERAHASRRADDQYLLSGLHVRLADGLKRGASGDGCGRGLLVGKV